MRWSTKYIAKSEPARKVLAVATACARPPGRSCGMNVSLARHCEPSPSAAWISRPVSGEMMTPISRMPASARLSITYMSTGRLATGTSCFAPVCVRGRRRVPALVDRFRDALAPRSVADVPSDGPRDAALERRRGLPPELALDLARVDGIAAIVARPVGDERDERAVRRAVGVLARRQRVEDVAHHVRDFEVRVLAPRADRVRFARRAFLGHCQEPIPVIGTVDPVPPVLTATVHGQR